MDQPHAWILTNIEHLTNEVVAAMTVQFYFQGLEKIPFQLQVKEVVFLHRVDGTLFNARATLIYLSLRFEPTNEGLLPIWFGLVNIMICISTLDV